MKKPGAGFGTLVPFDERDSEGFFGRDRDVAALDGLLAGDARVVAFTGPSGVGKTSLLRAGLTPVLAKRGFTVITLTSYADLERELVRAISQVGIAPPVPGQDAADYLGDVARAIKGGVVIILDQLEQVLADAGGAPGGSPNTIVEIATRVLEEGGPRTRLVLSIDGAAFAQLEPVYAAVGSRAGARTSMSLPPLDEHQVADILEKGAVHSGTPFESGMAGAVAADLCDQGRRCRAFDLQLTVRAIADLKIGALRRYRRSGGARALPNTWLTEVCARAGGPLARRALLAAVAPSGVTAADLGPEAGDKAPRGAAVLSALEARGLLVARAAARSEVFTLAHPALREVVEEFAIADRARATVSRRMLRRRMATGQRLRVREVYEVVRNLRGTLAPDERLALRRSLGGLGMRVGLAVALVVMLVTALYADSRRAYTLGLDPSNGGGGARVVVRLGRERWSFLNFLPNKPPLGSIIADTGYTAGGLERETAARIGANRVSGTLERATGSEGRSHVPNWLREVLNGLKPVPRGIVKALLGDPDGVVALKQAFSDPAARPEILSALAVIGHGGAGEDEILAGALADAAPEIRRKGVAVAAAIARRQASEPTGGKQAGAKADPRQKPERQAHAATLRAALADRSPDVRAAVLSEAPTLPASEAAAIVTLALRDSDPTLRRRAEEATEELAARAPAAVVDALADLMQSNDAGARRAALALFEPIAAKAPAACAPVLVRVVLSERVPEDARVAALQILRRTGPPSPVLRPALEKAIRPETSPRLRAAALPLYARLVSPAEAEEIARNEMKGPPAARAASAAVWGAVAATRPEEAAKPLKSMVYDPVVEVRVEAARAYGMLRREGLELAEKALADPNPEVERAALESALSLAATNPYPVADMLGRAVKTVRPAVRKSVVEALARMGESRPAVVLPPLARAIKDSDVATRVAAANGFCALAGKNAAATAPYLRIAARDDRDEVRTAAAACLDEVAAGDPKGAARMAAELAESGEPSVRIAAAEALGRVGGETSKLALPTLLKLLGDPDPAVRLVVERAFATGPVGEGLDTLDKRRATDIARGLEAALVRGGVAERKLIVAAAVRGAMWDLLRQAARDGDDNVRLEAVRAAGAGKGPGLEIVRGAVDDRAQIVRAEAMRLLAGGAAGGARDALPTFEAMLHGPDPAARVAAAAGIGELPDAGEGGVRLLAEALGARSEAVRAAAARALGRIAARDPERAAPPLEKAVRDAAYDVRSAALPGLALAWSRKLTPQEIGHTLATSDTDSTRRFVALEALVAVGQRTDNPAARTAARQELERIAEGGPALARLAARIGRSFADAPAAEMHAFIERLFGT
jgi:HEAT repeat protein